jgi:hypothetical protein
MLQMHVIKDIASTFFPIVSCCDPSASFGDSSRELSISRLGSVPRVVDGPKSAEDRNA